MAGAKRIAMGAVAVALFAAVLLAQAPPAASQLDTSTSPLGGLLNNAAVQVFRMTVDLLSRGRPMSLKLLNQLAEKREKRGDHAGAKRLHELSGWFSYVGLKRGVLVLATDLMGKRHLATAAWSSLIKAAAAIQKQADKDGWPDALLSKQSLLKDTVGGIFCDLSKGLQGSAAKRFFDEVAYELQADKHLAGDVASSLLGGAGVRSDVLQAVQGVLGAARSALYPGGSKSDGHGDESHHTRGGHTFDDEL